MNHERIQLIEESIWLKVGPIVKEGEVKIRLPHAPFQARYKNGYVLACQTEVMEDVEVEVLPESRIEGKILLDRDVQHFRALYAPVKKKVAFRYGSLVQNIYLKLPSFAEVFKAKAPIYQLNPSLFVAKRRKRF